jgi:hypothetical protein
VSVHDYERLARMYLRLVDTMLPERVVGFYVVGSAALGEHRPGRSDVDFVAVLDRHLEPSELVTLRFFHLLSVLNCAVPAVGRGHSPLTGTCNGVFVLAADLEKPVGGIAPVASHTAGNFCLGRIRCDVDWDMAQLVYYPSRAVFIDMVKSPEYLKANVDRSNGTQNHAILASKTGVCEPASIAIAAIGLEHRLSEPKEPATNRSRRVDRPKPVSACREIKFSRNFGWKVRSPVQGRRTCGATMRGNGGPAIALFKRSLYRTEIKFLQRRRSPSGAMLDRGPVGRAGGRMTQ